MRKTVLVSGGFDMVHAGHCHLIAAASLYGNVTIALNSDEWLIRKKGYRMLPFEDRAAVLLMFEKVADLFSVDDDDGTVCEALRWIKPDIFANGGDRNERQECEQFLREHAVCEELGILEYFNVGGPKIQSSSELVAAIR